MSAYVTQVCVLHAIELAPTPGNSMKSDVHSVLSSNSYDQLL